MVYAQVTDVSDIAQDDAEIQRKACELVSFVSDPGKVCAEHHQAGEDLELDSTYIVASDFQSMTEKVGAVLVQKDSGIGAFKVTGEGLGNEVPTVMTGPTQTGTVIVLIKPRQIGMCFGNPTLRYLYRK